MGAAQSLVIKPGTSIMVASLVNNLDADKQSGMHTCYIYRPHAFGNGISENYGDLSRFDIVVESIQEIEKKIKIYERG